MNFSGIILAGGKSSRMKTDKSKLLLGGRILLEIQIEKLENLGCDDIIVSGKSFHSANALTPPGSDSLADPHQSPYVSQVSDLIPDLGPMGGLYSCFLKCKHSCALVMSVDVPLLSEDTLNMLLSAHLDNNPDATVLTYNGHPEPLIGVYNTSHADLCKELIDNKKLAIRALLERLDCQYYDFHGDPYELLNCNTPEDYEQILHIFPNEK